MTLRGSGRTTKQIKEAPQNAVFICVSNRTDYEKRLAMTLGRNDIRFEPFYVLRSVHRFYGSTRKVVIDHAYMDYHFNVNTRRPSAWDQDILRTIEELIIRGLLA